MVEILQPATPPILFFGPTESESALCFLQNYPIFFGSLSAYNKIEPCTELLLTEKVSGPVDKIAEFNRPEDSGQGKKGMLALK